MSPDENFVVFITGFNVHKRKSEISVSRLLIENESFSLSDLDSSIRLDQPLSNLSKSAVAVQATGVGLKVIIAHCNGTHENKEVRLE
jgi:hypothetical protein